MKIIWDGLKKLKESNSSIDLVWCPGHCNIELNEEADKLAKFKAREVVNPKTRSHERLPKR